jgi:hypothetical protein
MASSRSLMSILLAVSLISSVRAAPLEVGDVVGREAPKPQGHWETVVAPDTLDLAERGRLALNYWLYNHEPDKGYSLYHICRFDVDPPQVLQLTWNLPIKEVRGFPWLRTMTGSQEGLDIEAAITRAYLKQIDASGMLLYPYGGEGVPKDAAYSYTQGLMVMAMDNWYQRDGNPKWLEWMRLVAKGLDKMAIRVEDRAYYPPESGMKKDGTWYFTTRATNPNRKLLPYQPPTEPTVEQQGFEGCVKYEQAASLRGLVIEYVRNHDPAAKELADKVVRFLMKPSLWEDTRKTGSAGNEHGAWAGHFHGNMSAFQGLLEYAMATDNGALKQAMREAYEHAVRNSIIRMGWAPFWNKEEGMFGRDEPITAWCEGCQHLDLVAMAVKLSDAGLGDYWDDVESVARNQMVEQQFTSLEKMEALAGVGRKNEAVLKKFLGGFGGAEPTCALPEPMGCCSANAPMGLYYAWHGITRLNHGVATVNLFLNRGSTWLDVDSWLPYEGKVVLTNKQARTVMVRIPAWLNVERVQCFVDDKPVRPPRVGRHLVFEGLTGQGPSGKNGEKIRLEFPVPATQSQYTMYDRTYTVSFRGATVVDIQPRNLPPASAKCMSVRKMYPIYERDEMKATRAPMRSVKRFIPDRVLPIQ